MNTTYTPTPHALGSTYKSVASDKLNVGDALIRCYNSGKAGITKLFEDPITSITLSDEGYVSLRLKSGDLSMREAGSPALIRTN